ncbi:MAG TPA: MATE family efflux transporter [Paracoccaceae bacterium]|nr:MATE family efflux transporter [Paracoccaceae bacterium]
MSDSETRPQVGKFVTGSLMRHVAVMSLSGALGLSFTFLVDFLALFWISRRGIQAEMAAVGIAGTIQFAILSLGIGMMIGAVALVARSIGMGDRPRARRIATTAMVLTVLVQVVLSLLIWVFRTEILSASGAEGQVLSLSVDFLAITLPSMPLIAAGILASTLLRTIGDAWRSMAVTMTGGAVAVVLDPLLIIWMDMGIMGAGWSIVLARFAVVAVGFWFASGVRDLLARPAWIDIRTFTRPYAAIALPAVATQLSTPFGNWILTREIAAYGEEAVAGWSVIMRLTILAFGGIFALSGAIGGIIGQNYGAGRPDRVAEAFIAALKFCAAYTLVTWLLMAVLSGQIVAAFHLAPLGEAVLRSFTHWAAGAFVLTGALFVANATFNNLGRPLMSTGANWFRDGILMLPLSIVFAGALGAEGIVWANAAANVIAGGIAAWFAWRYIGGLVRQAPVRGPRSGLSA